MRARKFCSNCGQLIVQIFANPQSDPGEAVVLLAAALQPFLFTAPVAFAAGQAALIIERDGARPERALEKLIETARAHDSRPACRPAPTLAQRSNRWKLPGVICGKGRGELL